MAELERNPGRSVSVYLMPGDFQMVETHMRETGRSFSWCLRDLARRGGKVVNIREDLKLMQGDCQ